MNKLAACVVLLSLSACSDDFLPEAATALEQAKETAVDVQEAYETAKAAAAALESVYIQACVPPVLPVVAEPCARIRVALDKVAVAQDKSYEALSVAFDAINAAIAAYNELNEQVGE